MGKSGKTVGKAPPSSDDVCYKYRCERYAAHIAQRNNLSDLAFKTSERYDHWVITLAGGAIAISLTFIEKIVPRPLPKSLALLGLSWGAYILAILAGFLAIHFSRKALYQEIENGDKAYQLFTKTSTDENPGGDQAPELNNPHTKKIEWLNYGSLSFLVVGTVLLCVFAFINVDEPALLQNSATYNAAHVAGNISTNVSVSKTNTAQP